MTANWSWRAWCTRGASVLVFAVCINFGINGCKPGARETTGPADELASSDPQRACLGKFGKHDPKSCQLACAGGDALSCNILGALYRWGDGVEQDENRAMELFTKACEAGFGIACAPLAVAAKRSGDESRANEYWKMEADYHEVMCDQGNASSCEGLANYYDKAEQSTSVLPLLRKARSLYLSACDDGDASACESLAFTYRNGWMGDRGLEQSDAETVRYLDRACMGGEASACDVLAGYYERGESVLKDTIKASELYKLACDGGAYGGCEALADAYRDGEGVAADEGLWIYYADRACSLHPSSCDQLAGDLWIMKHDVAESLKYFERGCLGDDRTACHSLASIYETGTLWGSGRNPIVPPDVDRARRYHWKTCELFRKEELAISNSYGVPYNQELEDRNCEGTKRLGKPEK